MNKFKKLDGTEKFMPVGKPLELRMHHTNPGHTVEIKPKEYVCADCGREGHEQNGPCPECESLMIVTTELVKDTFGENWRDAFKKEEGQ